MNITIVAVLCRILVAGTPIPVCVEEIVTTTELSGVTMLQCQMQGQLGVSNWMSHHPTYHDGWTLTRILCVSGHYDPPHRA